MKFMIVDAKARQLRLEDHEEMDGALASADLKRGEIDHGVLLPGLGYVVYEYGMFTSPELQHYWGFGGRLIAGNAVLYHFNHRGETADVTDEHHRQTVSMTEFFVDAQAVELAIQHKRVLSITLPKKRARRVQ